MKIILGADIGGTKCMASLAKVSDSGEISVLDKSRFETSSENPEASMEAIASELERICKEHSISRVDAIGVSVGGLVDSKNGIIIQTPVIPALKNYAIGDKLSSKFNAPAFVMNDANACALAEWKYGAGKGCDDMVFLTCGTGLGAGLVLNGKIYEGACSNAGEVGHIRLSSIGPVGCGKAGSFEGFCSGAGIAQFAQTRALEALQSSKPFAFAPTVQSIASISAKTLAEAAKSGDKDALKIFSQVGEYLGKGLAVIVDILNPQRIVLGSVYERCENLLKESMKEALFEEAQYASASTVEILPAKLGDDIGLYAAFAIAINAMEK